MPGGIGGHKESMGINGQKVRETVTLIDALPYTISLSSAIC